MTQPLFPLICITKSNGIDLVPAESHFSKVAASALFNTSIFHNTLLFDKNYTIWKYQQVSDKFKNNLLTKLLAKTFYNPLLEAKIIWTNAGSFKLKDLQEKLKFCVDEDDDIITQFEEAEIIKASIDQATNFDEIIKVLEKYIFAVNEEELLKERNGTKEILPDNPKWIKFDNGSSLGTIGSEGGKIIEDFECVDGARVTIEKDGAIAPFSVTLGIYGLMFHTYFSSTEADAKKLMDFAIIKIDEIFSLYETVETARDLKWHDKHNYLISELTAQ